MEAMATEVRRLRDLLPGEGTTAAEALRALRELGCLPEKALAMEQKGVLDWQCADILGKEVLSDTFVGLIASQLSKNIGVSEEVRRSAKSLVDSWRQDLRRWRAAASSDEAPADTTSQKRPRTADLDEADMDVSAVPSLTPPRERVAQKLHEALSGSGVDCNATQLSAASRAELAPPSKDLGAGTPPRLASQRPLLVLAAEIEAALFAELGAGREYSNQARSLIYNFKDADNHKLRLQVLSGRVAPEQLPRMSAEEMASSTKAAERAKMRQEAFDAAAVKPAEECVTDMFTCDRCHGNKTVYAQSTAVESCVRSGGEPVETLVTFVTCLGCGQKWTQRSGFA